MKSILWSVTPQVMARILNGEQTVLITKRMPKYDLTVENYLYCSYGLCLHDGYRYRGDGFTLADYKVTSKSKPRNALNGKVPLKFTLREIDTYDDDTIHSFSSEHYANWNDFDLNRACIHPEDFENYANDKWLYGLHITDLEIFERPMELGEFYTEAKELDKRTLDGRKVFDYWTFHGYDDRVSNRKVMLQLTRPPATFQFVEVVR